MLEYEAAVVRNYSKFERMGRNTSCGSLVHDACLQHQHSFTTSARSDSDGVYGLLHALGVSPGFYVEIACFKKR